MFFEERTGPVRVPGKRRLHDFLVIGCRVSGSGPFGGGNASISIALIVEKIAKMHHPGGVTGGHQRGMKLSVPALPALVIGAARRGKLLFVAGQAMARGDDTGLPVVVSLFDGGTQRHALEALANVRHVEKVAD